MVECTRSVVWVGNAWGRSRSPPAARLALPRVVPLPAAVPVATTGDAPTVGASVFASAPEVSRLERLRPRRYARKRTKRSTLRDS